MSLSCRSCGEPLRAIRRGMLTHERTATVFCGPRDSLPLPHPTTVAAAERDLEGVVELTTYRPRRHKAVRRTYE